MKKITIMYTKDCRHLFTVLYDFNKETAVSKLISICDDIIIERVLEEDIEN